MTRTKCWLLVAFGIAGLTVPSVARADKVTITIPTSVTFNVTNVSASVTGAPNPFSVSFSHLTHDNGTALYISVKANAANLIPPNGTTTIPAARVTWTTSNPVNGTGASGMLSASAFTQVFRSTNTAQSGSVDLTWTLAAPGAGGLHAGNHTVTLTWKLEVMP